MREGNIDRVAGAIIGLADVDANAIAPLRASLTSLVAGNLDLAPLVVLHPLARTVISLPFLDTRPDYARYLASEACALSHDDEMSRECVVTFLTTLGYLIGDGVPPAVIRSGPLDDSSRNGLDSDARSAWVKALEMNDFSDSYRLESVLSGVIALVAGARFGRCAIQPILADPYPEFWDAIEEHVFIGAPGAVRSGIGGKHN